jgi:hypothetical protein
LPPNPLTPTAVYGLDAGRMQARKAQRSRRMWDKTITLAMAVVITAGVVAGAWFGYQVYLDHRKHAEIEFQQGVDEMARKDAEDSLVDVIDDLEQAPTFNGPGAPLLGLRTETTAP